MNTASIGHATPSSGKALKHIQRMVILYPGEITAERVRKPGNYSLPRLLTYLNERYDLPIYFLNASARYERWRHIEFIHFTHRNFARLSMRLAGDRNTLIVLQMGMHHRHARLLRAAMPGSRILVRLGGVYFKKEHLVSAAFERERRALRRHLASADMVISTADGTPVDLFMERVGVEPARYRKWLNGFPVIPNHLGLRRENRIVCISRLHRGKLVDCVIRAYAMALPRLTEPHTLRIVGDGEERANLGALVEELGLRDYVEFIGHADDVGRHLYASKLLVSGLTNNPVMEAIVTHTPVITAEWGEMRALYGCFPNVHVIDCPALGFGPGPAADLGLLISRTAERIVEVLNNYPALDSHDNGALWAAHSWERRLEDELHLCSTLFESGAPGAITAGIA